MRALPLALSIATFAACAAHARPARADEPEETSPAPSPEPAPSPGAPRWYGWQILLSDASVVALWTTAVTVGLGDREILQPQRPDVLGAFGMVGLGVYLLGGPVVHGIHGEVGHQGVSLALRLGLPVAGAVVGAALTPSSVPDGSISPALIGLLVGLIGASVIDSFALAYTRAPATAGKAASSWMLLPSAAMSRDSAGRQVPTFGVSGAF